MKKPNMKILIIALSGAGDVLMSTPLIHELRKNYPSSIIDCLVMQGPLCKDMLIGNLDISNVIYFNFVEQGYIKSLLFCLNLRRQKYDLSITVYPQARYQHSLVSNLIGAHQSIGFSYQSQRLNLNNFLFNKVIKEQFNKHVVDNNLDVLNLLHLPHPKSSGLILKISNKEKIYANKFFKSNQIKKAAVIHAGSGTTKNFEKKRWPISNFAELCKIMVSKGYKILLVGGNSEAGLNEKIINESGLKEAEDIFNLAGSIDIKQTAALIERSNLVVSNDTLMGHIAAATSTKVISLFGPTSPENTAPYTKNKIIICKRPMDIEPYHHGSKGITREQAKSMSLIQVSDVARYV